MAETSQLAHNSTHGIGAQQRQEWKSLRLCDEVARIGGGPSPLSEPTSDESNGQHAVATALEAARQELAASSGSVRLMEVGIVGRPPDSEDPFLFRVESPRVDIDKHPAAELFVAQRDDGTGRIEVAQVVQVSGVEVVFETASEVSDDDHLRLFIRIDPTTVPKALVRYLDSCTDPGLGSILAAQGPLTVGESVDAPILNDGQRQAVGTIMAAGVGLVWGPPGTGKTRVIGEAVARLLAEGQTVAVVSNTNVAVDQALLNVARSTGETEAGTVVRVGRPSLGDVVHHPTLSLEKAVQVKSQGLAAEIREHRASLAKALEHPAVVELEKLNDVLDGATQSHLAALLVRRKLLLRRTELRTELEDARSEAEYRTDLCDRARTELDSCAAERKNLDQWSHIVDDQASLPTLRSGKTACDERLADLERKVDAASEMSLLRRRKQLKRLMPLKEAASAEADAANSLLIQAEERIAWAKSQGVTCERIHEISYRMIGLQDSLRQAQSDALECRKSLEALEAELVGLERVEAITPADEERLLLVDRHRSVDQLLTVKLRLETESSIAREHAEKMTAKIASIQKRIADLGNQIVADARVVGSTLAQLFVHRGLVERSFDYVIIDEASAVLPPYAFAALSKAKVGATLVGDFEQTSPISAVTTNVARRSEGWLSGSSFDLLYVNDALSAQHSHGCVVLDQQYRFGDCTMQLANRIAYGGLLRHGRSIGERSVAHPEIVVIDTAPLGDGATAEKRASASGRWWAAGAALSVELAARYGSEGVGVVTPYAAQAQITRSRFRDSGIAASVGTAHSFQGLEFPTVIVDLVEDGSGRSWVAQASRMGGDWSRSGLRLFNVGATRNSVRLFLICNAGSIRAARKGPLHTLGDMIREGSVQVWNGATLLGLDPGTPASAGADDSLVQVATSRASLQRILSESDFYEAFKADVEAAQDRVVVFSPFVTKRRLSNLVPVLRRAITRQVVVTVLTKGATELDDPSSLETLRDSGVRVQERREMHEKVVITDSQVAYVGSLNVLSNGGRTREMMMRFEGEEMCSVITKFMRDAARK